MTRILFSIIICLLSFQHGYSEEGEGVNNQIISSDMNFTIGSNPVLISKINVSGEEVDVSLELNEELQKRGINSLLSVGISDFSKSSVNRVKNIEAGMKKFDGKFVAKDGLFSFNDGIGNYSSRDGFVRDYIIKGGAIVLEQGGGVCQISTTFLRAALNAGLQIKQFRNHSIAIFYYKPYGLDSAIYAPNLDMRFVNNTPGDIYMSLITHNSKLIILFYGKHDGRYISFKGPYINKNVDSDNYHKSDFLASIPDTEQKLDGKKFTVSYVRRISYPDKPELVEVFTSKY